MLPICLYNTGEDMEDSSKYTPEVEQLVIKRQALLALRDEVTAKLKTTPTFDHQALIDQEIALSKQIGDLGQQIREKLGLEKPQNEETLPQASVQPQSPDQPVEKKKRKRKRKKSHSRASRAAEVASNLQSVASALEEAASELKGLEPEEEEPEDEEPEVEPAVVTKPKKTCSTCDKAPMVCLMEKKGFATPTDADELKKISETSGCPFEPAQAVPAPVEEEEQSEYQKEVDRIIKDIQKLFDEHFSYDEVQNLAEEMGNWRDGLQGTNLENSERYQTVSDTADAMENAASTLDGLSFPELGGDSSDDVEQFAEELEQLANDINDAVSEIENCNFPGMYG